MWPDFKRKIGVDGSLISLISFIFVYLPQDGARGINVTTKSSHEMAPDAMA